MASLQPPQPELPREAEAELAPGRGFRQRRPLLHQIEFFDAGEDTGLLFDDDEELEAQHQRVRARFREAMVASSRLLDPRLQRIIAAAAEGWVVIDARGGGGFAPRRG
jgi:hypothetical protein